MKEKVKKRSFLKGAALIAAGGFLAKIIGALYRIPLTNLIGGHGIGLYQLVYPVYCLLLTVSATGIPSSIAKLTAEKLGRGESDKPLFKTALRLFLWIGLIGTLLMVALAPLLASAQGSREVLGGYFTLAPSVLLVSAISVLRGWFQGRNDMFPTAISEVIEQAVKVAFGLFFAYIFRDDIPKAVVFLLLSVSISELVALLVMIALYRLSPARKERGKDGGRVAMKSILHTSIPVTLSALLIPLSTLIDSVVAVRLLGAYAADPVALYGLFAGGAVTVINLPVSVCYGVAAASIPAVATAKAQAEEGGREEKSGKRVSVRKKIFFSLGITVLVSVPAAVGLYYFAEPVSQMIFRSLKGEELQTLVQLIKVFALSAFTLSCAQTLSACLTAQGKPQYAAISMAIAMAVKTAVYAVLLKNAEFSVFGLAYATNIGYLVAFLLNFVYNLKVSKRTRSKANDNGNRLGQ
ncbi:MAG: polysaccharide biosynthesis protein [Clostridia bacterium]|nr:polysaccharide biosynthesis protein [Clostridia bacterium]